MSVVFRAMVIAVALVPGYGGCGSCPSESVEPLDEGLVPQRATSPTKDSASRPVLALNRQTMTLETLEGSRLPLKVDFGPLGHRVAWIGDTGLDRQRYVIDGANGPLFVDIRHGVFSEDGQQFAYAGKTGPDSKLLEPNSWFVLVGDEQHGPYSRVGRISFSDTGSLIWRATLPSAAAPSPTVALEAVVVDGVADPYFIAIPDSGLLFDEARRLLAYRARSVKGWHVVRDGQASEPFDQAGILTRSPDGRTVAYIARTGEQMWLVVGGRKVALKVKDVDAMAVLNSGQVAVSADQQTLLLDAASAAAASITARRFSHLVGLHSAFGYIRADGDDVRVVAGALSRALPRSTAVSALRVSPDGRRFVVFGRHDTEVSAFVDMDATWPASGSISKLAWSDNGKTLAYAATVIADSRGRSRPSPEHFVIVNGAKNGPFERIQQLSVAPSGVHHAFVVSRHQSPPELWVDGVRVRQLKPSSVVTEITWGGGGHWVASVAMPDSHHVMWGGGTSQRFDHVHHMRIDPSTATVGVGARSGRELRWEVISMR